MAAIKRVTARAGQRWDAIAQQVYSNSLAYHVLVRANTQYVGVVRFEGGESLKVPALADSGVVINTNLPPWRR